MTPSRKVHLMAALQLAEGLLAFTLWRAPELVGPWLAILGVMAGPMAGALVAALR